VKNVHELLAKLAWDFSPQQLDHLFECFQVQQQPFYTVNGPSWFSHVLRST